jgi:branched-chain amino acid transport system permease protein
MVSRPYFYIALFIGIALVLPIFIKSSFILNTLIMIFLYGYLSSCWNILGGLAGQHSFGHSMFFGLGAYTSSLLYIHWGLTPWLGMLLGASLAGLTGLFVGYLSFKYGLKGIFFLMITISFAEIFKIVFFSIDQLGGASGLNLPLRNSVLDFQFDDKKIYYYITLLMLLGIVSLTFYLKNNRMGYYFLAIRGNEDSAKALGIPVLRYKIIATTISAFFTAFGGTLYAQYFFYIDPVTVFGVPLSVEILIYSVVGGEGTILGPLLGAILLVPSSELLRIYVGGSFRGVHLIAYAALLVCTIIFFPKGIAGSIKRFPNSEG